MSNSKHRSGAGGERVTRSGFEYINRLFQGPEFFQEAGPLAPIDGRVQAVEPAPQGGHYIFVNDQKVYAHPGQKVLVKPGQKIEAGDELTDGVPHPRDLVQHRGIGEARRVLLRHVTEAFANSGVNVNRRNVEPIVAGLINHVRVTNPEGLGNHIVDDVVPFNTLAAGYRPRENAQLLSLKDARGKYLEEPVLHYTPGTRVSRRMLQELEEMGVQDLTVHDTAPDFEPQFERLMTVTSRDPDWQTRLGGFYIGRSFMDALHRGAESDTQTTSFVPALAQGRDFGQSLASKGRY